MHCSAEHMHTNMNTTNLRPWLLYYCLSGQSWLL